MGVPSLRSFVDRNPEYTIQNYQLKNTQLIIDGNNIQFAIRQAARKTESSPGHLCDYITYGHLVRAFLRRLAEANVTAIICYDGAKNISGHDRTRVQRARNEKKFEITQQFYNFGRSDRFDSIIAHNIGQLFHSIMIDSGIEIHSILFDADPVIARLANERGAPVLSLDSDFLLMDLKYGVVKFDLEQFVNSTGPYIMCNLFKQDNFVQSFPGLQTESLPLLAVVLGNDFDSMHKIGQNLLSTHILRFHPGLSRNQLKIYKMIDFLRYKTLSANIFQISRFHDRPEEFGQIIERIRESLRFYSVTDTRRCNELAEQFTIINRNRNGPNLSDEQLKTITNYLRDCVEQHPGSNFILELLLKNIIFFWPIVEDFSRADSCQICIYDVVRVMIRLLRISNQDDDVPIIMFDRVDQRYAQIPSLEPITWLSNYGPLNSTVHDLPGMTHVARKKLLLASFNYSIDRMESEMLAFRSWFDEANATQAFYINLALNLIDHHSGTSLKLSDIFKRAVYTTFIYFVHRNDATFTNRAGKSNYLKHLKGQFATDSNNSIFVYLHQISQLDCVILKFNTLNSLLHRPVENMKIDNWLNAIMIYKLATVDSYNQRVILHDHTKSKLAFD